MDRGPATSNAAPGGSASEPPSREAATAKARSGQASQHQLRILRALSASSPDFIYVFDSDHRFIYVSPSLLALWGKRPDEAVGKTFEELGYSPELVKLHEQQLQEAFRGRTVTGANAYVSPQGGEGHYEYTFVPVREEDGTIESVIGTTRDVTARVNSDRERAAFLKRLTESEEEFRHFANAMPQLAWIANGDGYITWYNRRWYEYTGTTAEQMEGWGWQRVHDPGELPRVLEAWKGSIQSGEPFEMAFPLLGADGHFRRFLTRVNPIRNGRGEVVRWFGTNTDIESERKMLEERDAAVRKAETALRFRDDFLAIASHELKTPLTALLMHIQNMERLAERGAYDRLGDRLTKARSSGQRLSRLMRELLDVSRISTGNFRLEPETMNLADLLREVCLREARDQADRICLTVDGPVVGYWDPVRLDQLLANLVSNALKYGEGKRVEVSVRANEKDAVVSVRDHGLGIAQDEQERIFERFARVKTKRVYDGFGLGLWISRQIVHACGGQLHVQSKEGEGSTFTVSLPFVASGVEGGEHGHPADPRRG